MGKSKRRSRRTLTYHGRSGHPVVHEAKTSGREYIMVRKRGGGTKRLYLTRRGGVPTKHRKAKKRRRK